MSHIKMNKKIRITRIQTIINKISKLTHNELWILSKESYIQNPVVMTNLNYAMCSMLYNDTRLSKLYKIRKERGLIYGKQK